MKFCSFEVLGKKLSLDTKNILPNLLKATMILGALSSFANHKVYAQDIRGMCAEVADSCNKVWFWWMVCSGFQGSCEISKSFCKEGFPEISFPTISGDKFRWDGYYSMNRCAEVAGICKARYYPSSACTLTQIACESKYPSFGFFS